MVALRINTPLETITDVRNRLAQHLLREGVTTTVDFSPFPPTTPQKPDPLPGILPFLEMTGVLAGRPTEASVTDAAAFLDHHPDPLAGIAPHAPYSVLPTTLSALATLARKRGRPLSLHVAESECEWTMFTRHSGPLHDWLAGHRPPMPSPTTPVGFLDDLGVLRSPVLAVHANFLDNDDVARLARSQSTVVHCPGSHAYFRHPPFPFHRLRSAGIPVCLGTDSLASLQSDNTPHRLSLLDESRRFASAHPDTDPETLLAMITTIPARALGAGNRIGALRTGCLAHAVLVPAPGKPRNCLEHTLLEAPPIQGVLLNGEPVL